VLNINDFTYDLPHDRIAAYPLPQRDESRLLVYNHGKVTHSQFNKLTDHLPSGAFLFFNDTKVIPARLHFKKDTGADIEIFLLSPIQPSSLLVTAMAAKNSATWECAIGNMKRWNSGLVLLKEVGPAKLEARLVDRQKALVEFSWTGDLTFAEVITASGETPLPPYIKREPETSDRERYQTIYSHFDGAVAAPTAGLHFTPKVFSQLSERNIHHDFLTLHVSAGTFQPVKENDVSKHVMHHEQIIVNKRNLENILSNDIIIPVGTTSMRTLESVYWFGVKLLHDANATFEIQQDLPYQSLRDISKNQAIEKVIGYMEALRLSTLAGTTSIFIKPGYRFRVCNALITNFHQPASTLILLVAAFVGPAWREIYDQALKNDYRFLSYGDSSLLMP
jgi:S-adenosylmethionine:tRNA ribosyltransferase-isomerase